MTPLRNASAGRPHLDQILDAAEAVVLRDGMGRLTIEAVAKQAGLSKAGLLHHVPGKDELVRAMVQRHVSTWHTEFRAAYEREVARGERRPAVSAMLATCLSGPDSWSEAERARNRVMVAALVHDEQFVEPLREKGRDIAELIEQDDLPPGAGETIHLAVHGLWFEWIFGMGDITEARLKRIRESLRLLGGFENASQPAPLATQSEESPPGGPPAKAPPAKRRRGPVESLAKAQRPEIRSKSKQTQPKQIQTSTPVRSGRGIQGGQTPGRGKP